uniref:Uncharacterized protein n=1 Tax=Eutreptiella gymnastica TaxID=73025 RepID=A0A7S4FK00_9EUGL|mmetsp:Transcript_17781/g.28105  ORF Transcript_17781/g.28105 Transcript_17781/m.28105 type:complete len:121 (-) Transcript_17781:345-707(-)
MKQRTAQPECHACRVHADCPRSVCRVRERMQSACAVSAGGVQRACRVQATRAERVQSACRAVQSECRVTEQTHSVCTANAQCLQSACSVRVQSANENLREPRGTSNRHADKAQSSFGAAP